MQAKGARPFRVAERIREELCVSLLRKVKDPHLSSVTVTEVRVTPDLKTARAYYTVFGDEAEKKEAAKALGRCRGFLRRELGMALELRYTPELLFVFDDRPDQGARIDVLLAQIEMEGKRDDPE
jgi:ribosome-binding factor A